uniref:G_PROTEIN_RECEP_F1_2 domain-containing protein n=1 Tax=Steinernema glaseri TaxID=37863 RepID=A0A1I7XYJ0_9BILA
MNVDNDRIYCLDFYMGTTIPLFPINYVIFMVGTTLFCCVVLAKIIGSQAATGTVSKRRVELNRKLNVTLIVLLSVTVAMGFFPCTVIMIFMMTKFNYTNVVMMVALPAAVCIPVCDSIVLVSFIRPYQKASLLTKRKSKPSGSPKLQVL